MLFGPQGREIHYSMTGAKARATFSHKAISVSEKGISRKKVSEEPTVPKHDQYCLVGLQTLFNYHCWDLCAVHASHTPENASIKNQQRPMYSIICRPTSLFRPSQQDTISVTSWSMAHILLMPSRMYKCIDDGGARQHNTYTRSVFTYKHQAIETIKATV